MTQNVSESPRQLGRYALYAEIASGGMATVHIGRLLGPVGFARIVALKRLHPHVAKDPEFVTMFLDEARIAARIRHPNVVPTLDVVAADGEVFLVMEYVEGEALSKLMRKSHAANGGPPPWRIANAVVASVLHGLHAAHEAKDESGQVLDVVHRDVSPQNVLVGTDGVPRVLDFGVAKARGRMQVTREGQLKGKLPYMAPEQIKNQDLISRRTDVYGASVVLWEALTGSRLYTGDEGEVLGRVLEGKVKRPSELEPSIPPELDAIVMRGIARDPETRFSTAREMALEIERVGIASTSEVASWVASLVGTALADRADLVKRVESAPREVAKLGEAEGATTVVVTRKPAEPEPRTRQPAGLFIGIGAGFVIFLGVLLVLWSRKPTPEPEAPVPAIVPVVTTSAPSVVTAPVTTAAPEPTPSAVTSSPVKTAKTTQAPVTKQKVEPNCDPPYYYEGKIKRFKPECLHK